MEKRVWNNRRRRSLYNIEDTTGFLYRKEDKCSEIQNDETRTIDDMVAMETSTLSNVSSTDCSLRSLSDDDLEMDVLVNTECHGFIDGLIKELSRNNTSIESHAEINDKINGIFREALEEPDLLPHPMEKKAKQSYSFLQKSLQKYKLELKEWNDVIQQQQDQSIPVHDMIQYLTEEQQELLHECTKPVDINNETAEATLNDLTTLMTAHLSEISSQCSQLQQVVYNTQLCYVPLVQPTETPRSLVHGLKGLFNNEDSL